MFLYEEYYNNLIICFFSGMESNVSSSKREDIVCGFLKLFLKSRLLSRGFFGGLFLRVIDIVICIKSSGSGSSCEVIMNDGGDEVL